MAGEMRSRDKRDPDLPPGPHRDLVDLLRRLRSAEPASTSQIALRAGLSIGHTSEVLRGRKTPSPISAQRIAEALQADEATVLRAARLAGEIVESRGIKTGSSQAKNLTDLLGELRRASGLSLGQVAVRSGFSVSYISEVISGKKTPSPDSAMKIATALGASRERALRAYNHAESHAELKRYVRTKPRLQNIKIGNGSHAFISYVREDFQKIDKLHHILENAGIPVWRDTADLWPGENWRAKIRSAITDNALVFIACFSNKSLARKSSFQNEELVLAIEQLRLRQPDEPWLIPVRLDDCILPELDIGGGRTLASIQHADLFGRRFAKEAGKVTSAAIRILGQANKSS